MVIVTKLRETLSKFPRYSLDAARRKSIKCFHRVLAKIGDHAAAVRCFLEEVHTYTELVDGFRNVVDKQRHVVERIFWFFLIWGFVYGTFYTCSVQWNRYVEHPTVISLERDYRTWNGTLPAISLCYYGRADEEKAQNYIYNKWNVSTSDDEYEYFRNFVEMVANATVRTIDTLTEFEDDERLEDVDFRDLIVAVHPNNSHVVTSFDDNFQVNHQMVFTELGLCYLVNAPIAVALGKPIDQVSYMDKPLTCNHQMNQCFLKLDIMHTAALIMVHSPFEVPVYDTKMHLVRKAVETIHVYKIVEVVSTDAVKYLSIEQRQCVFNEEMIGHKSIPTGSMCYLRCRVDTAIQLCGCKPFFYPFFNGTDCPLSGIICLQRSFWPMQALRVCDCKKSCTALNFLVNTQRQQEWSVGDTHFMGKSSFRVEILTQKTRHKRDILFSFEDFLVSFGGAVSLFLGCSIWKVIRLCYIMLFKFSRLVEILRRKKNNDKDQHYEFTH